MLATWIWRALVTELAAPTWTTLAASRLFALSVDRMAASLTQSDLAVEASPACDALLVACFVTSVVPKLVISRAAELGACRVEVMQVTLDPYPICDASRIPVIIQGVPVRARQNDTGVSRLLDDTIRRRYGVVVMVHGLQDEREGSRPAENKGYNELAIGTVRVGEGERAAAQHGAGSVAERTGASGGDVTLIFLEADAEECAAGTRARHRAVGRVSDPQHAPDANSLR